MSGTFRKMQRKILKTQCYKNNHNTKAFASEWEKFHYGMVEETDDNDNKVLKSKKVEKTKKRHFDDGKSYVKYLKAMKTYIDSVRNNQNKSNTNAKAKVC